MRFDTDPEQVADKAVDFVFEGLSKALGSPDYSPCDGTETWDGDVAGTVYAILRAARVLDPETDELATDRVNVLQAKVAELQQALTDHNQDLRSAFQAAQRDAIHEVDGTTRYGAMADAFDKTLRKHHAITNEARSALDSNAKAEG